MYKDMLLPAQAGGEVAGGSAARPPIGVVQVGQHLFFAALVAAEGGVAEHLVKQRGPAVSAHRLSLGEQSLFGKGEQMGAIEAQVTEIVTIRGQRGLVEQLLCRVFGNTGPFKFEEHRLRLAAAGQFMNPLIEGGGGGVVQLGRKAEKGEGGKFGDGAVECFQPTNEKGQVIGGECCHLVGVSLAERNRFLLAPGDITGQARVIQAFVDIA